MEIVPFQADHLDALQLQPAQAMFYAKFSPQYAYALEEVGNSWTALLDGRPIACAGIVEQWEGRGLAWALLAHDCGRHFIAITRAVQRALTASPFRRVEAQVDAEFGPGMRWAQMLGFEVESKMRRFTPEGRDAFMYVRIRE